MMANSAIESLEIAEIRDAVLDFMETTSANTASYELIRSLRPDLGTGFNSGVDQAFSGLLNESAITINGWLSQIDGIAVEFVDHRDSEHIIGKVIMCNGIDTQTGIWHLSVVNPKYPGSKDRPALIHPFTTELLRSSMVDVEPPHQGIS